MLRIAPTSRDSYLFLANARLRKESWRGAWEALVGNRPETSLHGSRVPIAMVVRPRVLPVTHPSWLLCGVVYLHFVAAGVCIMRLISSDYIDLSIDHGARSLTSWRGYRPSCRPGVRCGLVPRVYLFADGVYLVVHNSRDDIGCHCRYGGQRDPGIQYGIVPLVRERRATDDGNRAIKKS